MGILPIGFFSPLPLAMMIPFMATQSLAMGEAFGKSFQYGKRKISSLTNEEFNKLTFHDLMVEQTANISAIVPELTKQMAQSKEMQSAIFKEMVNLIPTFFDSLFSALDPKHIENPTLTTTSASPPPPITEIRYYDDRSGRTTPEASAQFDELKRLVEESLIQQGTKESLAEKLAPPPPSSPPYTTPPEKKIASDKVLSASEDPVYLAWITKLGQLKALYQKSVTQLKKNISGNVSSQIVAARDKKAASLAIKRMSDQYRDPNNHIRENALRLRRERASGQWLSS